ncbi:MAG: carbon-nitrogen hydrolase family protein [Candidatus Dormibacterales bacterium]
MRVAVGQFSAGLDKNANLSRISELSAAAAARGARLLVLPEGAMCDFGRATDDLAPLAEALDGPFVQALSALADEHGQTVVAGMFEAIPGASHIYNTAVAIAPRVGLVAVYRKRRLFDAFTDRESDRFQPGAADPPLIEVDGFRVGMVICYELRFPSLFESLADRGADLVLVPSAWVAGPLKEEHWRVLVHARAVDNTVYVAGAAQTGGRYAARSLIVDPFGVEVSAMGEAEGVAVADVSRERLAEIRARLPLLSQRREARALEDKRRTESC